MGVILSLIIPTCGRESLLRTLESVVAGGLRYDEDLIVVGDGPQPVSKRICKDFQVVRPVRYFEFGPTRKSGGMQRNFGITQAVGTHLMFMDDDDVYLPGSINAVREAVEEHPGRVLIFKEESKTPRQAWGIVWRKKEVSCGNLGSQGLIVPNVPERLGWWTDVPWSDYEFIRHTVDLYPEKDAIVVWMDRVIAYLY